ncbi:hypothetical protein OEZ85_011053 [Tetradesmus obliquus]|uniref:C962R-like N-terminal AEP domain-containing protein n=1 Tax=Tetradesmus obliquus TaxID=3088 RepID=A0ABY8TPG2_TETOB|nr:hypothetical protein OEZ85_011053 [Tetradesmus obliquus]
MQQFTPTLARIAQVELLKYMDAFKLQGGRKPPHGEVTHTLLTAPFGKYSLPQHKLHDFTNRFGYVVVQGLGPGFVEIKPAGAFRLFVDLDLKLELGGALARGDKCKLVACVHRAAISMFGASFAWVASCAPYNKQGATKQGLHIVWPDLFVGSGEAAAFREACIAALDAEFSSRQLGTGTWQDVIDGSVYRPGTGLRMIGAAKHEPGATVYLPDCRLDAGGALVEEVSTDDRFSNLPFWLSNSSLRVQQQQRSGGAEARGVFLIQPKPSSLQKQQRRGGGKPSADSGGGGLVLLPHQCPELLAAVRAVINDPKAHELKTAAIRRVNLYPPDSGTSAGPRACIVLNSKRCLNLKGRACHTSNHTYLLVQGDAVCQRCHSERKDNTLYGKCSDFNLDISRNPSYYMDPLQQQSCRHSSEAGLHQMAHGGIHLYTGLIHKYLAKFFALYQKSFVRGEFEASHHAAMVKCMRKAEKYMHELEFRRGNDLQASLEHAAALQGMLRALQAYLGDAAARNRLPYVAPPCGPP